MKKGRRISPPAFGCGQFRDQGVFDLIFHAVAFALDGDGLGVMQQAIQHGGSQRGVVVEDLGPVLVGLIGGQQRSSRVS